MKTVRRPPYPKWNPGYFPCSSLTPLPVSSRRPSVSFGGFGLTGDDAVSPEVQYVRNHNGSASRRVLRNLQPDVMVLRGTGIIRMSVLDIPKLATIGAHHDPLPELRGMNVIEWALLLNRAPTVSTFIVDPGIDTSAMLLREPIPVVPGDTIESLRERAGVITTKLLADTVIGFLEGEVQPVDQSPGDGRQYFVMHPRMRGLVERKLDGLSTGRVADVFQAG